MSETHLNQLSDLPHFVSKFLASYPSGAIVGLSGELGAGKTTFVRSCVESLCIASGVPQPRVASPSFVLRQSYPQLKPPIEHFDLYRLTAATPAMLLEIGYYEAWEFCREKAGFLFVEWPSLCADPADLRLDAVLEIELAGPGRLFRLLSPSRKEC